MKTLVIWDLDGTITESKPWIIASYKYAARKAGLPEPSDELLSGMMCGGLQDHITQIFGKTGDEAQKMADYYREYYTEHCLEKVDMFHGFPEIFQTLEAMGITQAVATMKLETAAVTLLDKLGISRFFVKIAGADSIGRITKTQMIKCCVATGRYDKVVMIGDCPSDRHAAEKAGVEFLAAAFGYGYPKQKCISDGVSYVEYAGDITKLV